MPEGDTVYLAATRLHTALAGSELRRTDFAVGFRLPVVEALPSPAEHAIEGGSSGRTGKPGEIETALQAAGRSGI